MWTIRQILEAHEWGFENCSLITLTYSPEHYPDYGSLKREHFNSFRKKLTNDLRKYKRKFRYFGCGEYGDKTERAHYHLNAFGIAPLEAEFVRNAWPFGFVDIRPFIAERAAYTTGYVVKNKTRAGDMGDNRIPEFSSKSPGLGKGAIPKLIDAQHTKAGADHINATGDVFLSVRLEGKEWPLGRYLINLMRDAAFGQHPHREALKEAYSINLDNWVQSLREDSDPYASRQALVEKTNYQHGLNIHARNKIKRSRRTL